MVSESEPLAEVMTQISVADQGIQHEFETNYDANNATIDCPLHMDLASDETVEALMVYCAEMRSTILEKENWPTANSL